MRLPISEYYIHCTYILSLTISKLLWIIGQIFAFDAASLLNHFVKPTTTYFGVNKLEMSSIVRYEMYFDILNYSGVAHKCDRQTNGRSDRMAFSKRAA